MRFVPPRPRFASFPKQEPLSVRPDVKRALRSTVAFMIPLLAIQFDWLPLDPMQTCIAAQTICLVDVRVSYSFRLGLLLTLSAILVGSVAIGAFSSGHLALVLGASALIFLGGGIWRHLSTDYGAIFAVSSGLLFFITLGGGGYLSTWSPVVSVCAGAFFGLILQVITWLINPQQPLRMAVGETWIALAEMIAELAIASKDNQQRAIDCEQKLRSELNKTQAVLQASKAHATQIAPHLEALNLSAARMALRVRAFRTTAESQRDGPEMTAFLSGLAPVIHSLSNLARGVALAVVSRQTADLVIFEIRLKRLQPLLEVARSRLHHQLRDPFASTRLADLIQQVEDQLPEIERALRSTLERSQSQDSLPLKLPDLGKMNLRPLAATLSFSKQPDIALIRHTARIIALGVIGVLFFQLSKLSHGYWLPFTILVVLQPDFGATRERAFKRVIGTIIGGTIASSLLWLHLPLAVIYSCVAVTIFVFGYFLRKNYAIAVTFITLMVVLMTEAHQIVTLAFTLERMGSTLAGGALALGAAWLFWPTWERRRFPAIFSKALSANRSYLELILRHLRDGIPEDAQLANAHQHAEAANSEAFSSLQRMLGDPKSRQDGLQQSAALANANQRIINALSAIALQLDSHRSHYPEPLERIGYLADTAFETLIAVENFVTPEVSANQIMRALQEFQLPKIAPEHQDPTKFRDPWVLPQLFRVVTELNAMLVASLPQPTTPGKTPPLEILCR